MQTGAGMNLESLFNTAIEGALSTKMKIREPGMYNAQITKVGLPQAFGQEGDISVVVKVFYNILEEGEADESFAPLNSSIFLDLTPENTLDMREGRNVQLGRLREALGQNDPNTPWSFADLNGCLCQIVVGHGLNKKSGEVTAEVKKVLPAE